MGIAPYKTFTFDGVSSSTYGVYLTGEGVFNAPERAVEMIEIPGRNGNFALDEGRFQNISVTYKVGMFDVSESNFATKVSAFRNWLCSKIGYVRLSDEYNPDEYRMAVYSGGLELEHDFLIAGEAEITFECKPQRWLTSGETATAVANNGTLSNPTLFDSSPLLAVKGYGDIAFNGYGIGIENVPLGYIMLFDSTQFTTTSYEFSINQNKVNMGDPIQIGATTLQCRVPTWCNDGSYTWGFDSTTITDTNSSFETTFSQGGRPVDIQKNPLIKTLVDSISIVVGTNLTVTNTASVVSTCHSTNKSSFNISYTITQTIIYDSSASTITFTVSVSTSSSYNKVGFGTKAYTNTVGEITANSTASALGNPTYIDCEIGECYMVENNEVISLNSVISLGSDLPTLATGTNTFTYDNTVTELKVTPRWWKV